MIEVIIVSVIVAILAAAAIPVYSGYVRSQKKSMAKSLSQSAAVTANIYYRRTAADPTVAQLNLFLSDPYRYKVTISGRYVVVSDTSSSADPQTDSAAFR